MTITATYNGVSKSASLPVLPAGSGALSGLTCALPVISGMADNAGRRHCHLYGAAGSHGNSPESFALASSTRHSLFRPLLAFRGARPPPTSRRRPITGWGGAGVAHVSFACPEAPVGTALSVAIQTAGRSVALTTAMRDSALGVFPDAAGRSECWRACTAGGTCCRLRLRSCRPTRSRSGNGPAWRCVGAGGMDPLCGWRGGSHPDRNHTSRRHAR